MSIEQQRSRHDRRARAWVYLVLGLLAAWVGLGIGTQAPGVWGFLGWVIVVVAVAAVVFGLWLFQPRRP